MNLNYIKKLLIDEYPFLSRYLTVNYGLIPEELKEEDYVMGANNKINWKVLKPDSNWQPEAERMINEVQRSNKLETMNCTRFALNNVKEMLHINKWNEVFNYSDRFPGNLQGTTRNGNTLSRQLEIDRKLGCVKESDWAWNRAKFDWNEYYATPPQETLDKGLRWLKKYTLGYDSVWATKSMIIEALKYSPLYCGLYAWYRKGMLYYSVASPNHACTIINRNSFMAYDSYNPHIKNLDEGFKIYYVKRIYLEKRDVEYNEVEIKKLKARGFKYIMRTEKIEGGAGQIYKLTDDNKMVEISDQEKLEIGIQGLAQRKDLTGISEKYFTNLSYCGKHLL